MRTTATQPKTPRTPAQAVREFHEQLQAPLGRRQRQRRYWKIRREIKAQPRRDTTRCRTQTRSMRPMTFGSRK